MKDINTLVNEMIPRLAKNLPHDLVYKQRKQNLGKTITKLAAEKGQGSILDQYFRDVIEGMIEAPEITKQTASYYKKGSTVREVEDAVEKCEMRVLEIVCKQAFLSGIRYHQRFIKTKKGKKS